MTAKILNASSIVIIYTILSTATFFIFFHFQVFGIS